MAACFSRQLIKSDRNDFGGSPALGKDLIVIAGESGEIFATPYDYCLRAGRAAGDADCDVSAKEALPDDGASSFSRRRSAACSPSHPRRSRRTSRSRSL